MGCGHEEMFWGGVWFWEAEGWGMVWVWGGCGAGVIALKSYVGWAVVALMGGLWADMCKHASLLAWLMQPAHGQHGP